MDDIIKDLTHTFTIKNVTQIDDRKLYTGSSLFFAQHQSKRKTKIVIVEVE